MSIQNIDSSNVSNVDNAQSNNINAPSSGPSKLDLSNPFVVGDLLESSGAIKTESEQKSNDDVEKTNLEQDAQKQVNPDNQDKKETPYEKQLTPEEIEKLIASDPKIQKIQELEKMGYSKEDAVKIAYNVENPTTTDNISYDNYNPINLSNDPVAQRYLQLTETDINAIKRLSSNPTTQDLVDYLNRQEQRIAKEEGRAPNSIIELPEYEDAATNIVLRDKLRKDVIAEYSGYLQYWNKLQNTIQQNTQIEQNFNKSLTQKVFDAFPVLNSEKPEATLLANHLQDMFSNKVKLLDSRKQSNLKELEKVFDKTLEEFKPLFDPLCNKLGISFEAKPPQGNASKMAEFQMKQMTNVNNNQTSGGESAINISNVDPSNPIQVGNLLEKMGVIK